MLDHEAPERVVHAVIEVCDGNLHTPVVFVGELHMPVQSAPPPRDTCGVCAAAMAHYPSEVCYPSLAQRIFESILNCTHITNHQIAAASSRLNDGKINLFWTPIPELSVH